MLLVPWAILAKGAGVNNSRRAFGSLHQVGQNRLGEQGHHGARRAQIRSGNRATGAGDTDDNRVEAFAQIGNGLRPGQEWP